MEKCAVCGKQGEASAIPRCSRCKMIRYCSRACQSHDWPCHKTTCKAAGTSGGSEGASGQAQRGTGGTSSACDREAWGKLFSSLYPDTTTRPSANARQQRGGTDLLYPEEKINMGSDQKEAGKFDEETEQDIQMHRLAIDLQPNLPDAYYNLGVVLHEKGQMNQAEQCYNQALKLQPDHPESLNNLAILKQEQGHTEDAIDLFPKDLEKNPQLAEDTLNRIEARYLHGWTHFKAAFRPDHAPMSSDIPPNIVDIYNGIGTILRGKQNLQGAMQCYSRAIRLNPACAEAHLNVGLTHAVSDNILEAIAALKTALKLKPDCPLAYFVLTRCLQIVCDWKDYKERMVHLAEIVQDQIHQNLLPSVLPRSSIMCPLTAAQRKAIAACYARFYADKVAALHKTPYTYPQSLKASSGRLRIGYVSSDFCNHPTSHLMQSIPGMHDRSRVEISCYALRADDDTNFRRKIESEAEHFVDLSKIVCNGKAADRINADGIHILLDMNGYTDFGRNEIFALKPTPIQAMWLGYPGTSGADYMDYIITDRVTSPLDLADHYSEKLAYVPDTFFVGDHRQMFPHILNRILLRFIDSRSGVMVHWTINGVDLEPLKQLATHEEEQVTDTVGGEAWEMKTTVVELPASMVLKLQNMVNGSLPLCNIGNVLVQNGLTTNQTYAKEATGEEVPRCVILSARASYGLPENAVVFCNFCRLYKLDPDTLAMWVDILKLVPNSVLWLLRYPAEAENNVLQAVAELSLSDSRVVFSNFAPKEEQVRRGQLADVCLDTPLCNGHTTGMDVLWAGTPMVTLPGDTLASRVASSQLSCLGCPELIARSPQHYVDIAVKLGTDMEYLRAVQAKVLMARSRSPLFNTQLYTQNLENLYFRMWNRMQNEQPPDHLTET